MKRITLTLMIMMINVFVFAQEDKQALAAAYLKVKDALVASDSKAASTASAELLATANKLQGQDALKKSIAKLSKQSDLEKQREAFADISDPLWKVLKSSELQQSL